MFNETEIISFNCKLIQNILFPDDDGDIEVIAEFEKLTFEKFSEIENKINKNEYTLNEVKKYYLNNLKSINITSIENVLTLPYKVINKLVELYMETSDISDEEETTLNKQASIVFSGGTATNACSGIRLYCLLTSFYEKFGLTLEEIKKLPYKEFITLKMLITKEGEIKDQKGSRKSHSSKAGDYTKIKGVKPSGPSQKIEM